MANNPNDTWNMLSQKEQNSYQSYKLYCKTPDKDDPEVTTTLLWRPHIHRLFSTFICIETY